MYTAYRELSEGGFADRRTVRQGQTIRFHIADALDRFDALVLQVVGPPGSRRFVRTVKVVRGLRATSPVWGCLPDEGCDWPETFAFDVPARWPPGWYRLAFPVRYSDTLRYVDFVVAESEPKAELLFIFDVQTAQAYNVYGGGSSYGLIDETGAWSSQQQLHTLSFRRPMVRSHTYAIRAPRISPPVWIPHEEEAFRLWLASRFRVSYLSNDELETIDPGYLERYPVIVIVGQQEYWSNQQLERIRKYVTGGGSLFLSAIEFAYAAIRYDPIRDTMTYYYDPRDDPILSREPGAVATVRCAVSDPEDFFGVSLEVGKGLGISDEFSPLRVVAPHHWAFAGLGFRSGEVLASVKGLGVGAWIERSSQGDYAITSSRLNAEQVQVLAVAEYPPLTPRAWGQPEHSHENFNHSLTDFLADGLVDHTSQLIPEKTFAVVAMVRQGKGMMFVGPGGWMNSPHPHNTDPRVPLILDRVIRRLVAGAPFE
jgi:hypothetical protein